MSAIKITTQAHRLIFRHPFRIAHGIRTGTDVVYVRMEYQGVYGFGEATLPPYLPDTVQDTLLFLNHPFFRSLTHPCSPAEISEEMNQLFPSNFPGKAAVDMALWQLKARTEGKTLSQVLGTAIEKEVPHSYTIGIGSNEDMKQKLEHALEHGFSFFKLKLDGLCDDQVVEDFHSMSQSPFAIDANQAWTNIDTSMKFANHLAGMGCVLIEQPFRKEDRALTKELKSRTSTPIIADEAFQTIQDIEGLADSFSGINLKLQKCGGVSPAMKIIARARQFNMKVLIGCMSESSVGCDAAEALTPLCDWADLDGPWLIQHNPDMTEVFSV